MLTRLQTMETLIEEWKANQSIQDYKRINPALKGDNLFDYFGTERRKILQVRYLKVLSQVV